jgi:hypothetical protein
LIVIASEAPQSRAADFLGGSDARDPVDAAAAE